MSGPDGEAPAVELTVLMMTVNEAGPLAEILPKIGAVVAPLVASHEILVVDGNSTDQTLEVARGAGARGVTQREPGYGGAYREGLAQARGRWIFVMDADGSHPVDLFPSLWERREGFDVVAGSRYLPGGEDTRAFLRRALSLVLNRTFSIALGIPLTDFSGALRLYRAEALRGVACRALYFDVTSEMLSRLYYKGCRMREIPYRYAPRLAGESKARILVFSWRFFRTLVALFLELRLGLGARTP